MPKRASQQIRFAVVGCGRVSPRHFDSLQIVKRAKLVAVCDVKPEVAKKAGSEYNVPFYTDFQELLNNPEIDAVALCTPSGLHPILGIQAAQAGKHVLVEKPIAVTPQAADQLIAACKNAKVKLAVVLQNRFNPPMLDLKKLIERKRLGELYLGSICVRWFRPQSYYDDEWHGTRDMDGGVLMDQSIHHTDALVWLMGMPESVFAKTATLAHTMEMEDVAVGVLKFPNGAVATIEASTLTYPQNLEGSVALFGSQGSVKIGGTALNKKVLWKVAGELDKEADILAEQPDDPESVYGHSHPMVYEDFIDAIMKDRQPLTHGEEGKKSLLVVSAFYKSARTGKEVKISELL